MQVADFGLPYGLLAYRGLDAIARALAGDDIKQAAGALPRQLLEKTTVDDSDGGYWPGVTGYVDQFRKLWGVS